MKPPVIPDTLRICERCEDDIALMNGKKCLRCALARWNTVDQLEQLLASQEAQPQSEPEQMCSCDCGLPVVVAQASALPAGWPSAALVDEMAAALPASARRQDLWERLPKAPPLSPEANAAACRITAWVGLLVLWAFASGWAFGRFA
jgi:hypothetical protein